MDALLWEGSQILLDSGLLTEVFQRSTFVQLDAMNMFESHLKMSQGTKDIRIRRVNEQSLRCVWDRTHPIRIHASPSVVT